MNEDKSPPKAPERPRRITASDVAKVAGVSRAAVSRAFSPKAYLDAGKRALILKTAKDLGYRPNALAASLQGAGSGLVAVVAGDIAKEYDSGFVGALVAGLNKAEKWPLVISGDKAETMRAIRSVLRYPLEAIIVRGGSLPADLFEEAALLSIPVIYSGRVLSAPLTDCVSCRNDKGARLAIEALLARGRRRIGYLGGPEGWPSESERHRGVSEAMAAAGQALSAVVHADYSFGGGRQAALKMLAAQQIDGLFCANDAMALGGLSAARALGVAVPEALSIIGFDDTPIAAWPDHGLTTIRNPVAPTVREILRLLASRAEDITRPGEVVMIEPELITRDTL